MRANLNKIELLYIEKFSPANICNAIMKKYPIQVPKFGRFRCE